jgi:hypothetical protein
MQPPREKEPPASRATEAAWRSPSPGACCVLIPLAANLVSEGTGRWRLPSRASIRFSLTLRSMSKGFGSAQVLGGGGGEWKSWLVAGDGRDFSCGLAAAATP